MKRILQASLKFHLPEDVQAQNADAERDLVDRCIGEIQAHLLDSGETVAQGQGQMWVFSGDHAFSDGDDDIYVYIVAGVESVWVSVTWEIPDEQDRQIANDAVLHWRGRIAHELGVLEVTHNDQWIEIGES